MKISSFNGRKTQAISPKLIFTRIGLALRSVIPGQFYIIQIPKKVCQTASYLHHEVLFNFGKVVALNQTWLARHGDDLNTQCDFAEKHFTTSRFAERAERIAGLLAHSNLVARLQLALRAIGIANLHALKKTQSVPQELSWMERTVNAQSDSFRVGWNFGGTRHYISNSEHLASHRDWLLSLFTALEAENRAAILSALQQVRQRYNEIK